jgi:murein DD-endopeptidase MepM/ murein hydrolase activator NlpD
VRRSLVPLSLAVLLTIGMPLAARADTPSPCSSGASPAVCTTPVPPVSSPPTSTTTPTSPGPPTPTSPVPPTPNPQDAAARAVIDQTRSQIGGALADALAVQQQLTDALTVNTAQQDQVQQRIDASQFKLDQLDSEIQKLSDDIDQTQQQVDGERAQIAVLARALYQQPNSLLIRLMQAGNLRELVTEAGDLSAAAYRADALKQKLSHDLDQLDADQTARQRDRDAQADIATQLAAALTQLQQLSDDEASISDQLQALIDESQAALSDETSSLSLLQRIAGLLRTQRSTLIATAEQAVWRQAQLWAQINKGLIPVSAQTTAALPPGSSRFVWPERNAVITQAFGPSTLWLEPAMYGFAHFHTGIDLAGGNKTIVAAADGIVAVVGSGNTGYGNYVLIVHAGGIETLYGHLSVAMVKPGDRVAQGQPIGIEGNTGASTGPHLHFEVRVNGTPIDPMPFLPGGSNA